MEKITSRRNPLCIHMKKLGASRGYREEHGEFLCDGIKLLEEAVKSGADVTNVLTATHVPFPLPLDTRVFYTERGIIDSVSPLKNAQEVLLTCKIPEKDVLTEINGTYILLDGVQDPGNAGAIIRTADAFGIKGVILTGACADVYNPKTIRASMGAIFRQNVSGMIFEELARLRENGARFVGTLPGQGRRPISEASLSDSIIAIGSEGAGLSDKVISLCCENITIPIAPQCESLNAAIAAAIIMWEATRRGREASATPVES